MKDAHQIPPFSMRLPDELKTWLKHQAIDNRRSLNNELLIRLEQSRVQQTAGATQ